MRVIKVIAYELININRKKKRTIKRERKEKREEN
jgi:hypothetical protein